MANIYSLQLLRNGQVFTSKEQALTQLTSGAAQDGVIKLARYTQAGTDPYSGDTNGGVKTIFAFRHEVGGQSGWTVYEDYKEVLDIIKAKIDSLSGEGSGSIYDQIMQEINKLDYSGVTTGDGVVVTNVTETDGKVSATAAEVGGLKLTNYALGTNSGAVAANDTINEALSKLQNQVNKANEDAEEAIKALDANITAENGFIIDHIEQVDGKISGTTKALPSLDEVHVDGKPIIAVSEDKGQLAASAGTINAEFVNVADTNSAFTATTVEDVLAEIDAAYKAADAAIVGGASDSANTLGKLEGIVNGLNADAATYTIRKDTENLPAEIKERYTLVETKNGTPTDKQVTIDIPKDSHIVSINYISNPSDAHYQNLEYVYLDASGATKTEYVDMANLILETEFASGVTSTNGVAHGVVDPTSESFLTVGEHGFKLAGVQDAIDAAVSSASTDLQDALDELSGKAVTNVAMTGGTAAITANTADGTKMITINTDGSQILATGYAKGSDASAIAATDSINAALAKLENQVDAAKAAATTKVVEGTDTAGVMTIDENVADSGNTYTINLSNIAKADAVGLGTDGSHVTTQGAYTSEATTIASEIAALDAALNTVSGKVDDAQAEIDRIESGAGLNNDGTYSPDATNTYTSGATSLADAIDKLDAAATANKIVAGDGIEITEAADGTTVAVDLKEATGNWENALAFDNGKLYVDHIDAGTY